MKTIKPFLLSVVLFCSALLIYGSLNSISATQSIKSDSLPEVSKKITGHWKAVGSSGGFTGKGFTLDFDYLTLKENGTFELRKKNSLIANGKVALSNDKKMVICNFIFDNTANVQLAIDPEKYIQFTHADTLTLAAPCCDRYNIKLAREK